MDDTNTGEVETDVTPTSDEGKTSDLSRKPERTEREKAEFSLKKNAERLEELGGNPADVLGVKSQLKIDEDLSDETPLTVGNLREIQKADTQKTALKLAEDIEDEDERKAVREVIERLKPSDDARADLELARTAVNAKRTAQIAADVDRKLKPTRTAAGGSAPSRQEDQFEPTDLELTFMAPPYNVSKAKIIEARQKAQK